MLGCPGRVGHGARDGDAHARVGAVGDHRAAAWTRRGSPSGRRPRPRRWAMSRQRATAAVPRVAPAGAWGRPARYAKVVSSGAIMPARAPASIDMLQTVMRSSMDSARMAGPAVLDDVAGGAADADLRDQGQDDVLGRDARRQPALTSTARVFGLRLEQALRGQHVPDLAGADAEGQRAERAVGAGVAVPADDGHAGLGEAQLGPDDVHDALALAAQARGAVMPKSRQFFSSDRDLRRGLRVREREVAVLPGASSGWSGPWWPP